MTGPGKIVNASRIATEWKEYSGGIDNEHVDIASRLLNSVDQSSFAVGLKKCDFDAQFTGESTAALFDFCQRRRTVDFRFALAKQVQVRTVQNQHTFGHGFASSADTQQITSRSPSSLSWRS